MENLFDQIANVLTTPPGNLAYLLILVFSLVISFQAIIGLKIKGVAKGRFILGTLLLLAIHIVLFAATALAWQGMTDIRTYLPPLDRSITTISFIWIAWMWIFPKKNKGIDIIVTLLSLAVVSLFIFSFTAWETQQATSAFNTTLLDWSWSVFYTLVIVSSILLALVQKPDGWGLALVFFNINLLGSLTHMLLVSPNSDFSGFLRLAQLCSFPLLPGLIYHHAVKENTETLPAPTSAHIENITLSDWGIFTAAEKPNELIAAFSKICSQTLNASSCVWFDGQIDVQILAWGYNNLSQNPVNRTFLDPQKYRALIRAVSKIIPSNIELNDLTRDEIMQYDQTILEQPGTQQIFIYPMSEKDGRKLGAFAVTFAQSGHEFIDKAENLLNKTHDALTQKFYQHEQKEILHGKTEALERELSAAHHQITRQADELKSLRQQIDETSVIASLQLDTDKRLQQLEDENRQLTARLASQNELFTKTMQSGEPLTEVLLDPIIDDAIASNATLMLDRNIILELDIPQNRHPIKLTAVQTTVLHDLIPHLFSFACKTTKENGVLQITAKQELHKTQLQMNFDVEQQTQTSAHSELVWSSEAACSLLEKINFRISQSMDGNQMSLVCVLSAGV